MINPIKALQFSAISGLCSLGIVAGDVAGAAEVNINPVPEAQQAELLAQTATIVEVAASDERFSTLVTAVEAAGLVETLSGEGPFTVFAPTNAAFAALPPDALNALLEPENQDLLTEVLTYHVVAGEELGSDSVVAASSIETLNGDLNVNVVDGEVMVGPANVIVTDVQASNGIIHAIDTVLIPDGVVETLEARMMEAEMTTTEETVVEETTTETTTTTETVTPAAETTPAEPVRGLW